MNDRFAERFALTFVPETQRRVIAGSEVIIHCHHYNSRIQHTVESAADINGTALVVSAAEAAFADMLSHVMRPEDDEETRWAAVAALYAHLGFGRLNVECAADGVVTSDHSHYVEGWNAGFPERDQAVCSVSRGFLQAAYHVVAGRLVDVREDACRVTGAEVCRFTAVEGRSTPLAQNLKTHAVPRTGSGGRYLTSPNVDEDEIVRALVEMPIHGDAEGLIPAFNVYLANMPADFYNLLCLGFVEAMDEAGLGETARFLLMTDGETCGMNTFRGIMASPEWDALVGPMLHAPEDPLYGIIAVSNALGWGHWHVRDYRPGERLQLESPNGYEACGAIEYRGSMDEPACLMLRGVSAGIMELLHGEGPICERFGVFEAVESSCLAAHAEPCVFEAELAA